MLHRQPSAEGNCEPSNPTGIHEVYATEVLLKSDPRYHNNKSQDAISDEISGLLERQAFAFVHESEIPENANVLGGRMIMAIKNPDTELERYKARFVVQGHRDKEKDILIHTSKTVKYRSKRLMCAIAAILGFNIWNQDVTQAYIQGHPVTRDVYVKPAPEFNLPKVNTLSC